MRRWLLVAAAVIFPAALFSESADEHLRRIREAKFDAQRCYRVRDLFLEREDVKIYFTDGRLIFAEPVAGRTVAALFVTDQPGDEGEILLMPPTAGERQSLARFTGDAVFNPKIQTALMFFTDDTAEVLREQIERSEFSEAEDTAAGQELADKWSPVLRNVIESMSLRIFIDTLDAIPPEEGFFAAALTSRKLGRFDVVVDPRLPEQVVVGQQAYRNGRRYYEYWCRFEGRSFRDGRRVQMAPPGNFHNYKIESTLLPDLGMNVIARAEFVPGTTTRRSFGFELSERLRLTGLRVNGEPIEFLQLRGAEAADASQRRNRVVVFVLPATPDNPEQPLPIEFQYEGKVVADAGNGVYLVGSRGSWYPRLRMEFTQFELKFHFPKELDLVATGEPFSDTTAGGVRTRVFRTEAPIRLAGFNLGNFRHASREVGDYIIEVLANERAEDRLQPERLVPMIVFDPPTPRSRRNSGPSAMVISPTPPDIVRPADRIGQVADDSAEAFEFFLERLGPPPTKRIVISPIPGGFGQGFPGLVYASTLSYFLPGDRPLARMRGSQQRFYTELLRPHEISHQWWGNLVAVDSESDAWLLEALATYSALMLLEHRKGRDAMQNVLNEYRDNLLEKNDHGETIESAGAISLGFRLRSSRFPQADRVIMYQKGAWILHMLRGILGDENFLKLLRSVRDEFEFQPVRVDAFRKQAAKYLPQGWPDRELRNFFEQWVYGTGIPELRVSHQVRGGGSRYRFTGRLMQSSVPDYFSVVAPVEIHTLPGRSLVKHVPTEGRVTEFTVTLQNKPSRVVLDPQNHLLAVKND